MRAEAAGRGRLVRVRDEALGDLDVEVHLLPLLGVLVEPGLHVRHRRLDEVAAQAFTYTWSIVEGGEDVDFSDAPMPTPHVA